MVLTFIPVEKVCTWRGAKFGNRNYVIENKANAISTLDSEGGEPIATE